MGQHDGSFLKARKKNSKTKYLVLHVIIQKNLQIMQLKIMQDYIAFGSFFKSKLKQNAKKPILIF